MKNKYTILVACAENGVIGNMCKLPWHIPDDLQRFKRLTINTTVVMGAATFKSVGKVLPNRRVIIITSGRTELPPGDYEIAKTIDEAIFMTKKDKKVFICGGELIYRQFMDKNICDNIYLTLVNGNPEGDRLFPFGDINEKMGWELVEREKHETHTYMIFNRMEKWKR